MDGELSSLQRANQLEEDVCELLIGKRTPGSGSKSQKGDVKSAMFLAEAKLRDEGNGSWINVGLAWLETIWEHARREEKHPLLVVENGQGDRAVLLPSPVYESLGGGAVKASTGCPLRSYCLTSAACNDLPLLLLFHRIEVAAPYWVVISWEEMLELRRTHQPKPESAPASRLGASQKMGTRLTRWPTPAPWRKRSFR